jgi:hypothetical protein
MDARAVPPPGSALAGDLYVDAQTRCLWLGVDNSIDPSGFLLISDLMGMMAEDLDIRADTKAYTESYVHSWAAPKVHKHTASDITDFDAAVADTIHTTPGLGFVKGMIMMWSGSLATVPSGWHLCDGGGGTPNLRDRFVIAAGNLAVGSTNPQGHALSDAAGNHAHTLAAHAITIAEMPHHNHGNTGTVSHNHRHHVSLNTSAAGNHTHGIGSDRNHVGNDGNGRYPVGNHGTIQSAAAGNHSHVVSGWTGYIDANHYHGIPYQGSSHGHTHGVYAAGSHQHYIASAQLRASLPYYALAYIMKL